MATKMALFRCSICGKEKWNNRYQPSKCCRSCAAKKRPLRHDMTNKKFGRIVALFAVRHNGRLLWHCRCDYCGKEFNTRGYHLRKGITRSCGCKRIEFARQKTTKPKGQASFNILYNRYKRRAEQRGLKFDLDKSAFKKLTSTDCFYCGQKPQQQTVYPKINGTYIYNGIDRKNNKNGYALDNCVPCCGICNRRKMDMDFKDFIGWVKKVCLHQKQGRILVIS